MLGRETAPATAWPGWWRAVLVALFLLLLVLLPGLGRPQLTLFDEGFHAVVARQLLEHPLRFTLYDAALFEPSQTDWAVGHSWHHVPPLPLWQMALSFALFGITTFAFRLPSALLHVGAAFVTYRIGQELFGRGVATAAMVIQALSPLLVASVYGFHPSGHFDLALLFWSEVALLATLRGARTGRASWFAGAGVALGLALLAGGVPALPAAIVLLALAAAAQLRLQSAETLDVRPACVALAAGIASAGVIAWIGVSLTAGGSAGIRAAVLWLLPEGLVHPRYNYRLLAAALPGLAIPAMLAMLVITARAMRHPGELFLAAWGWGAVIPLSIATHVSPSAGIAGVPVLALALAHTARLALDRLARAAPERRPVLAMGALAVMLGVTAYYGREAWRAAGRESPDDGIPAAAARLRALPSEAVFILDEPRPTGAHLSLMFWAGRPVHSLGLLRKRQPMLSHGMLAAGIRRSGGVPYLLAQSTPRGAPPPVDTAGRYRVYAIGPTAAAAARPPIAAPLEEWRSYGADPGGMRYSPLTDIDRSNVAELQPAWLWPTGERAWRDESGTRIACPGRFEATPLMINDTLYVTTPFHRLVALDAETGALLWSFDPHTYRRGQPYGGYGFVHRGAATWTDGETRRLLYASRGRLYAVDAATGRPVPSFGRDGVADLISALEWSGNPDHVDNTSPPVVYRDLVIVGSSIADEITYPGDPPGAVIALDVRTGRRAWIYRTIPGSGEAGHETWRGGTHHQGHANVWAPMTLDTARGLVFAPVGAASNDWYGGARPGENLYAESLVALDVRTGKRVWHFQTVHHGLWDYDLAAPPVLAKVRRQGRALDVVAAAGKTGFLYVFDRETGKPLWPIVERPVPASDVPGEVASPTQPFPTWPKPFTRQGFTENDVVDFTPEIRDSVLRELRGVRLGPIFTPPSVGGTVVSPGWIGGAPWGGGAYDPESQLLFVRGNNMPLLVTLLHPGQPNDTVNAALIGRSRQTRLADPQRSCLGGPATATRRAPPRLPLGKPPYGTLTAIDLASGEHRWQVPIGDSPAFKSHPALRGLDLPQLGQIGTSGATVTAGGVVFISGGSANIYGLDSRTGAELWKSPLPGAGHANPMTYRTRRGRQFVVIAATDQRNESTLVAFALPWR